MTTMTGEERLAFTAEVVRLYETLFGYPPDSKDPKKAAHYVQWRYGGQGLEDAVRVIRELRAQKR